MRILSFLRYNILAMEKFYYINTYGCQMNVHESEKIAGILEEKGYRAADSEDKADIIVFNTCCIRDNAEKKIFGNIGDVKKLKKANPNLIIAVVGCMSQQKGIAEKIKENFPFVNIVLGTSNFSNLSGAIDEINSKQKKRITEICNEESPEIDENIPIFRTSGTNAWVNIMYGCNNFCTYCIVPYVRGRERSRSSDLILDEIKRLLDEGYKEITLLGQNVDSYNYEGKDFAYILKEIAKLEGKFRLRFMSSHPKDFKSEIIDIIRSSKNICNNIHLPVQSGSDRVLKLMNRKYTRDKYLDILNEIREKLPDCGITSDIMVGFPTETDEDFQDTLSLVEKAQFSTAFTFVYSPRKGTVAAEMPQLPEKVKKYRITELVKLQNEITRLQSQKYIDTVEEILVEDVNPKAEGVVCGRSESGRLVNFEGNPDLIGKFKNVRITSARNASLWGKING